MLPSVLHARSTVVWAALVFATVVSWALGSEHGTGSLIALVVLAVAMIKVRFVGLDFMELRTAPLLLRAAFECYCVLLWCVLAGMYFWV